MRVSLFLMLVCFIAAAAGAQVPDRPEADLPARESAPVSQEAVELAGEKPDEETSAGVAPETQPDSQPASEPTTRPVAPTDPQFSARSTIRELLLAVTQAKEKPERIRDAVACIDFGGLDAGELEKGPQRAEMLAVAIDEIFKTTGKSTDDAPDDPQAPPYVLFEAADPKKPESIHRLSLSQQADGRWRFNPESIAALQPLQQLYREKTATQPVEPKVATAAPPERASARATMDTFLKAINAKDQARAAACLDLSELDAAARDQLGRSRAVRLKEVMDRIRPVVLQDISDRADGDPYTFYLDENGRIEVVRQSAGARKDEWLFSAATVATIEKLFKALEDRTRVVEPAQALRFWDEPSLWVRARVPAELKHESLGLELWQWYGLALTVLVGVLIRLMVGRLLPRIVRPLLSVEGASVVLSVLRQRLRPISRLTMLMIWWGGVNSLDLPTKVISFVIMPLRAMMIVFGVWSAYNIIDLTLSNFALRFSRRFPRLDDVLVPLLRKTLKVILVIVGVTWLLLTIGVDVAPLLAGLGLGGLAFGLAAQDTLKNFFGSINVVLDRPFQVGDWIKLGATEGTVESVGLRSTRIRTLGNSEITIPNSDVMNATIDNLGRRRYRRIQTMLSVEYGTRPEQLEAFCEAVRELVRRHPQTRKEDYHVAVNQFAASSIDILLVCWLDVTEAPIELRERHRLFVDILRVAQRLGVSFAFPTQTVQLRQGTAAAALPDSDAPDAAEPVRLTQVASPRDFERVLAEGRAAAHAVLKVSLGEAAVAPK